MSSSRKSAESDGLIMYEENPLITNRLAQAYTKSAQAHEGVLDHLYKMGIERYEPAGRMGAYDVLSHIRNSDIPPSSLNLHTPTPEEFAANRAHEYDNPGGKIGDLIPSSSLAKMNAAHASIIANRGQHLHQLDSLASNLRSATTEHANVLGVANNAENDYYNRMRQVQKAVDYRSLQSGKLSKGAPIAPHEEEVGVPVEPEDDVDIPDTRMPGILREMGSDRIGKSLDERMDAVAKAVSERRAKATS